jgi:hypothetical protein
MCVCDGPGMGMGIERMMRISAWNEKRAMVYDE